MAIDSDDEADEGRRSAPLRALRASPQTAESLIGRHEELELLVEAATDPPSVVVVEGEEGIGKTRLMAELLSSPAISTRRRLLGFGHRIRDPFPLGPVIEAVRALAVEPPKVTLSPVAGALRPLLPELGAVLPRTSVAPSDARAQRHQLFRGLLELLDALGPTVVILEDLHWADYGTAEFLEFLVGQQPRRLALITTYRPEDTSQPSPIATAAARAGERTLTRRLRLSALSPEEVAGLAACKLGGKAVSRELATLLHEHTAGNPFAVTQLVKLLRERGELALAGGQWTMRDIRRLQVPPAVRDTVLERARLLPRDARLMLESAAVLEGPADEELTRTIAGLPPARARASLSRALGSGLLRELPDGRSELCHGLARQALYDAIAAPNRRWLHARAARALKRAAPPLPLSAIAHHFKAARITREWRRYSELAADACMSVGDDRGAAELLQDALDASAVPEAARVRMSRKLAVAALFGRLPYAAIPVLGPMLASDSLAPGVRGELRFLLARLLYVAGDSTSAQDEMIRASNELRRRPSLAAQAMANLAETREGRINAEERIRWIDRALIAAERQHNQVVSTHVLGARASVHLELGDPAAWQAVAEIPWNARSREQRLELVRVCKYLAGAAAYVGHYGSAHAFLDEGERIRRELEHERFGVGLGSIETWLDWSTGQWKGLEGRLRKLIEATADAPVMRAFNHLRLAAMLLNRGDLDGAEGMFRSLLDVFRESEVHRGIAAAAAGLATIALARSQTEVACELATFGVAAASVSGSWTGAYVIAPAAVDALLACGRRAEATALVQKFSHRLQGRDAPASSAALEVCRAALLDAEGLHALAARRFERAERRWRALPCPYEAARAGERRALSQLAAGESTGADCLLHALAAFDALPAPWDSRRVRAALRSHGVALPYPWRGGRRAYGEELSPREAEVASLAATGKTNAQIAEFLFLSPRTVESHVASAMRKLRVASRGELYAHEADDRKIG